MSKFTGRMGVLKKYMPLLKQLVFKDVKLKYRRSFLGYIWSILNPLLIMLIMVFVFSHMFRFDIEHYAVYLLCGQIMYTFVSESTNQSINSIIQNAGLLKKTYVPKYIFPLSKVTSSLVNLVFSLGALLIVMIFQGVRFNWYMLFIPIILLEVYFFSLGIGLFLAQANVFFRDTQYIYAAFLTAWMYATPIFYPIQRLPETVQWVIKHFNPLYSYIAQFRDVILNACMPGYMILLYGTIGSVLSVIVGTWAFLKTQDKFILYI